MRIHPIAGAAAKGEVVEGRAVFLDRYPSTDAAVLVSRDRIEELLVLRDRHAPSNYAWRLQRGAGLAAPRQEDGALVFRAAKGQGELRITPVFAVDARGTRLPAVMRLQDDVLKVDVNHEAAIYPVVLDPGVVSGAWSQGPSIDGVGANPALAYDPARQRVVLVAGGGAEQSWGTWEYDGAAWTRVSTSGPKRYGAAMAYFPPRAKVVLHGGIDPAIGQVQSDAWEWDGASWSSLGSWDARYYHAMAYDSVRSRLVMVGGAGAGGTSDLLATTLEWDGTSAPQVVSSQGPTRIGFGLVFDPLTSRTLCIGGRMMVNPYPNDLAWNGSSWSDLPFGLVRTDMAVLRDPLSKTVLADGGGYSSDDSGLADTRFMAASNWELLPVASGPPGRKGHAGVYDEARGHAVFVGGNLGGSWTLALQGGACTTGAECSTGHCVDGVCCDSAACGVCESCNQPGTEGACAAVKGMADDTCPAPSACDLQGNKTCVKAQGQPCVSAAECASGQCSASGKCVQQCASASECNSGFCVDGMCCPSACSGQCESCHTGDCLAAIGAPPPGRPGCGDGSECSAQCDGVERAACHTPGREKTCSGATPPVCVSENALQTFSCDGYGACLSDTRQCSPYACRNGACSTSCASDADCEVGHVCSSGKCSVSGKEACAGPDSLKLPDGTVQSCGRYRCYVNKCLISCETNLECAAGAACKAGRCRAAKEFPPAPLSPPTCTCRSSPAPSGGPYALLAGALVGLGVARRRRRLRQSYMASN